jgi:hypothetical protein
MSGAAEEALAASRSRKRLRLDGCLGIGSL